MIKLFSSNYLDTVITRHRISAQKRVSNKLKFEFTSHLFLIIACRNTSTKRPHELPDRLVKQRRIRQGFCCPRAVQLSGEAHYTALFQHRNKYLIQLVTTFTSDPCHLAFTASGPAKEREL